MTSLQEIWTWNGANLASAATAWLLGCVQAKGRLQCWNADGQELGGSCREGCAGKGQAATLEQQRVTMRGLGGSCREGIGRFEGF